MERSVPEAQQSMVSFPGSVDKGSAKPVRLRLDPSDNHWYVCVVALNEAETKQANKALSPTRWRYKYQVYVVVFINKRINDRYKIGRLSS